MRDWGAWALRLVVGYASIFVTFAYLKNKARLNGIASQVAWTPVARDLLAAHGAAMVMFGGLSFVLYAGATSGFRLNLLVAAWFAAGFTAIALGACAFLPWSAWMRLRHSTGYLWIYALVAALSGCVVGNMGRWTWQPVSQVSQMTFALTKMFLSPFVSGIIANPTTMVLGTQRFQVEIAPQCSGLEGVGLILAFGVSWLLLFRKECRFPQSLALVPLGAGLIFLLNAARIAALILIGNAGAEQIALGGFHSQAGWIAFSAVAVGFCIIPQRVSWFTTTKHNQEPLNTPIENPTAAYLMPILMILGAGMLATAAAGSFEWLYPLRFFAAVWMLWIFRRSYVGMGWEFDWLAPAIGAVVFLLWIALDRFPNQSADAVPAALMTSSALARATWITFRVLAGVVTVPLAEELAFRGFLMRRLVSADFDRVPFRSFTWFALLVSSIAFGLLHGAYWITGCIAGILFALAVIRRGKIGEAVVAHATANALLAVYVLGYHKWHLW